MTTSPSSQRRPRLLYIAFYFPPTRASGVYRALATANHFADQGWDVTVVTVEREFFTEIIRSVDPSIERYVHPGIRVERVHYPATIFRDNDIRTYSRLKAYFPVQYKKMERRRENRIFPEVYSTWIPHVVRRARELHTEQPFDMVLATGNPHSAFGAAWRIKRELGVPYAVDYRDSWTLDLFEDAPAYPEHHPAWKWERRILADASRIVYVNDALLGWHAQRYPDAAARMMVVQNGYDPAVVEGLSEPVPVSGRPLRYGYLGTVTSKVPLEEFFDGWRLMVKDDEFADSLAELHGHLGFFPSAVGGLHDAIPLDEGIGVSYEGPVAKADVGRVYQHLDVLLLIIAGSRYVTSGKVYEYMATGKPIVSVHLPECAASEVLRDYPLWFPAVDLSPEAVQQALVAAGRAARELTAEQVARAREYARRFTREAQLTRLENALKEDVHG